MKEEEAHEWEQQEDEQQVEKMKEEDGMKTETETSFLYVKNKTL